MNRRLWLAAGLCVLAAAVALAFWWAQQQVPPAVQARLGATVGADISGFARVEGPWPLAFPADHGPHPQYQTEWWYYTGNLEGPAGEAFGFQLTFFRRGLTPGETQRPSAWGGNQVYFAHFALTDGAAGSFTAAERFSRGAAGLAGAQATPFRVWLDGWSVEAVKGDVVRLRAAHGDRALDLTLTPQKPPAAHGGNGFSPKSAAPGNASVYYSLSRLAAAGQLTVGGRTLTVNGAAWMDHEWSTSALGTGQVGWDWYSLQLDDGWEVMFFQIRLEDGRVEPVSSGSLVAPDGTVQPLRREELRLEVQRMWQSPHSRARYPAVWLLEAPAHGLRLTVEPLLADQELNLSFVYWEGAVQVSGSHSGQAVKGRGYVELTGYAHSMQGEF
ncbi:MAG: carotenoid 1,2-hydratase [Chloroflexi bacterium]|nr:carotenoid 1,2-hydratase [Chloroflexota bacterium]